MTEPVKDTIAQAPTEAKAGAPAPAKNASDRKHGGTPDRQDAGRNGGGRGNGRRPDRRERAPREAKEFEETILLIRRVTRVVKGGRRMRFSVSVVIGDKNGRVGFGIGKSAEVMGGVQKAVSQAKKAMIRIPIYKGSIPHQVNSTYKASRVLLFPAPEGTGIIAGGGVRKIMDLSGVKNVLSKTHGSRNAINIAYATFKALAQLQKREEPKKEEVKEATPKAEKKPVQKPAPKKEAHKSDNK